MEKLFQLVLLHFAAEKSSNFEFCNLVPDITSVRSATIADRTLVNLSFIGQISKLLQMLLTQATGNAESDFHDLIMSLN